LDSSTKIGNGVTSVVLAGGFGTRVRHLLPDVPKPMAPVLGRPFLDWILSYLERQGVPSAVLSTGHLSEVIERHYQSGLAGKVRVTCVRESTPLGTAGGFLYACQNAGELAAERGWLVLNGDSLTVTSLEPLFRLLDDPSIDGGLLAVPQEDASRFGTLEIDARNRLLQFREKRPGAGLINAGVYLLRPRVLEMARWEMPLSFETQLFPTLISRGADLRVVPCTASFLDIGTPETLRQAEEFVTANHAWF